MSGLGNRLRSALRELVHRWRSAGVPPIENVRIVPPSGMDLARAEVDPETGELLLPPPTAFGSGVLELGAIKAGGEVAFWARRSAAPTDEQPPAPVRMFVVNRGSATWRSRIRAFWRSAVRLGRGAL